MHIDWLLLENISDVDNACRDFKLKKCFNLKVARSRPGLPGTINRDIRSKGPKSVCKNNLPHTMTTRIEILSHIQYNVL